MKSIHFKTVEGVLGCLLPLICGISVFVLFMAMILQGGTGIGVLQGTFYGFVLGLLSTIVVNLIFYPVNRAVMARRLKKGGDNIDRLACWHDPRTGIASYLASTGVVTGDETYYWGGVYMTLEGVHLEQKPSGLVLIISLGRQMTVVRHIISTWRFRSPKAKRRRRRLWRGSCWKTTASSRPPALRATIDSLFDITT